MGPGAGDRLWTVVSVRDARALAALGVDGVVLVAGRARSPEADWHGTGCTTGGRRRTVKAPVTDHHALDGTHLCRCAFHVVSDTEAVHALVGELHELTTWVSTACEHLERAEAARPGSAKAWSELALARRYTARAAADASASSWQAESLVQAWAATCEARCDALAGQGARGVHEDLVLALEDELGVPDGVDVALWDAWRRARVAGKGAEGQTAAMLDALGGAATGVPLMHSPVTYRCRPWPVRLAGAALVRRARQRLEQALADRVDAAEAVGGTRIVAYQRRHTEVQYQPVVVAAVGSVWAGAGRTLLVPAGAAHGVARLMSGTVVGEGDQACAQMFEELRTTLGEDEAYKVAVEATS